jgi:hypothetical protein
MSTLTFTGKQHLVRAKLTELVDLVQELFPIGAPIAWRTEVGWQQTGTVITHHSNHAIRVVDGDGFYSIITVADILRAQS